MNMSDNNVRKYIAKILRQYPNGAISISENGVVVYICYNNGDKIWFDNEGNVKTIQTHDGVSVIVKE